MSVLRTSTLARGAALAATGLDAVRDRAARGHVAARLGRLRGLPQKVGQMLSLADDDHALAALREAAEPVPFAALSCILEEAWSAPIDTVVRAIEPRGRAASIGQVHRAELHDGRTVAVKIQYPGIAAAIASDLKLLGWISEPAGGLRRGFDLDDYRTTIRRVLDAELDYRGEAERQAAFAHATAHGVATIVVPNVVEELSGARVLVTEWEDGAPLAEVRTWDEPARHQAAAQLVATFCAGLFDHGHLHADPHPGNFRFRRSGNGVQLVLYDYGCVHRLNEPQRLTLLRLVRDTFDTDTARDPWPTFLALGFDRALLEPLRPALPALCRVLLEPFGGPMKFDASRWRRAERLSDVLGDDRWNFRMAGPAHLLPIVRAFQGLVANVEALGVPVCWSRFLRPVLARDAAAIDALDLPEPPDPERGFAALARHLVIHVRDGDATLAHVTLPVDAVDDLRSVMDADVLARVAARGIDIDAIARDARRRHYAPQALFSIEDGSKAVDVRLH